MTYHATEAGRALYDDWEKNGGMVLNRVGLSMADRISAIEAEAAMRVRRRPECPTCDDEWAAHVAGLHEEPQV